MIGKFQDIQNERIDQFKKTMTVHHYKSWISTITGT